MPSIDECGNMAAAPIIDGSCISGVSANNPSQSIPFLSSKDNWKHRSQNMLCGTCTFFVQKITSRVQRATHVIGRCRRSAPTMKGYPVVFTDDWCGEHKLDEEKI